MDQYEIKHSLEQIMEEINREIVSYNYEINNLSRKRSLAEIKLRRVTGALQALGGLELEEKEGIVRRIKDNLHPWL